LIHYGIGTVPVSGGREMQWVWREDGPQAWMRRASLQWREKYFFISLLIMVISLRENFHILDWRYIIRATYGHCINIV
jgi:hypothetical protein